MELLDLREVPELARLYLCRFGPGREVEFVDTVEPGVPRAEKWVLMISTQVGCAVGCRLCDAGIVGFKGDLSAAEMLAQIERVLADNPGLDASRHPKLKIHFARMGEPSLNPAVLEALRRLSVEHPYPGLMPSLSTVAPDAPVVTAFMEELLRVKDERYAQGRFQLQFSLHGADEEARRRSVPIKAWSFARIAEYGRRWVRPGDRRVTLNFALPPGERLDAKALAAVFDPASFLIKITPVNPTAVSESKGTAHVWMDAPAGVACDAEDLRARGFTVVVSPSLPEEIEAATSCGQLWSRFLRERAETALRNARREAAAYVTVDTLAAKARAWVSAVPGRRKPVFRAERSALLVVDLQAFFVERDSPAYRPEARAILGSARRLADAFRAAGRPVLFSAHAVEEGEEGLMGAWWDKTCRAGFPEAEVARVLEAPERDVYRKARYSAFAAPGLCERLRAEGVSDLVVCGVMTNLCVESTVRAAFDLGFQPFVPADVCAARTEAAHVAALRALSDGFAPVLLSETVKSLLAEGSPVDA